MAKASTAKKFAWGGIALMAVFGAFLAGRIDLADTVPDTPLIGTPVPGLTLPLLEGEGSISLTDFSGDILVINFWASWCLPCRTEHPQLVQAAEHFSDKGVRFISIDHEDTKSDAIAFLDELGRSSNQIVVIDEGSRAGIEFGIFGNPATFFVNREGVIVGKIIGPVDFAAVVSIVAQIEAGEDVGVRKTGETFQGPDS